MNASDPLVIAGKQFSSRLLIGTGKYSDNDVMNAAHEASGAEIDTIALGRVNFDDPNDLFMYNTTPSYAGIFKGFIEITLISFIDG